MGKAQTSLSCHISLSLSRQKEIDPRGQVAGPEPPGAPLQDQRLRTLLTSLRGCLPLPDPSARVSPAQLPSARKARCALPPLTCGFGTVFCVVESPHGMLSRVRWPRHGPNPSPQPALPTILTTCATRTLGSASCGASGNHSKTYQIPINSTQLPITEIERGR